MVTMVSCPVCSKEVKEININSHLDSGCTSFIENSQTSQPNSSGHVSSFFKPPAKKPPAALPPSTPIAKESINLPLNGSGQKPSDASASLNNKRPLDYSSEPDKEDPDAFAKRVKSSPLFKAAPLAERMRPRTLDDVYGQELVGPNGVLRGLIESNRVPSEITSIPSAARYANVF